MTTQIKTNVDDVLGWFDERNRVSLDMLIQKYQIKSVLEIGSFMGLSAIWFAQRVENVTCVDTWAETAMFPNGNNTLGTLLEKGIDRDFFGVFNQNIADYGVSDKIAIVRGLSSRVAHLVNDHDLVYIDADHTQLGCASDLHLYGPKAKKILCGDDYTMRPTFGVIEAVQDYVPYGRLFTNGPFWWTEIK